MRVFGCIFRWKPLLCGLLGKDNRTDGRMMRNERNNGNVPLLPFAFTLCKLFFPLCLTTFLSYRFSIWFRICIGRRSIIYFHIQRTFFFFYKLPIVWLNFLLRIYFFLSTNNVRILVFLLDTLLFGNFSKISLEIICLHISVSITVSFVLYSCMVCYEHI